MEPQDKGLQAGVAVPKKGGMRSTSNTPGKKKARGVTKKMVRKKTIRKLPAKGSWFANVRWELGGVKVGGGGALIIASEATLIKNRYCLVVGVRHQGGEGC